MNLNIHRRTTWKKLSSYWLTYYEPIKSIAIERTWLVDWQITGLANQSARFCQIGLIEVENHRNINYIYLPKGQDHGWDKLGLLQE